MAAAGDRREFRRVERVDRDIDPAHAAIIELTGIAGELAAVGRQGQLGEGAADEVTTQHAKEGDDIAAH